MFKFPEILAVFVDDSSQDANRFEWYSPGTDVEACIAVHATRLRQCMEDALASTPASPTLEYTSAVASPDESATALIYGAISHQKVTVGLLFRSTFAVFHVVNTPYVAFHVIRKVLDFACNDRDELHTTLSSLTTTIDDKELALAQAIAATWPEPLPQAIPLITPLAADANPCTAPQFSVNAHGLRTLKAMALFFHAHVRLLSVGVVGSVREGKSTLMSKIIEWYTGFHLDYFSVSAGLESHTKGASCYVLPHRQKRDTWIVFVDFEGFGDADRQLHYSSDFDVRLFAIAIGFLQSLMYNTAQAVNNYMLDRLQALQYVASDTLKVVHNTRLAPNRPTLFLVLRDFHLLGNATVSPEKHYRALLRRFKSTEDFFDRRFRGTQLALLPRPVEGLTIDNVNAVPLGELLPAFVHNLETLAKSAGFCDLDSRSLDNLQAFVKRISTVVNSVNASKSQAICMTSALSAQSTDRILARLEIQFADETTTLATSFPMQVAALENQCAALVRNLERVFSHELKGVTARVEGLETRASDAWNAFLKRANRRVESLLVRNDRAANDFAAQLRATLLESAPAEEQCTHPTGHENNYESFMTNALYTFTEAVTERCPREIKTRTVDLLHRDLGFVAAAYTQRNCASRAREHERETLLATQEANRAAIADLQSSNESHTEHLAKLRAIADGLNEELVRRSQEKAHELEALVAEHQVTLARRLEDARTEAARELADHDKWSKDKVATLSADLSDAQRKVAELEQNLAKSRGGCFPSHAVVETRAGPLVQMDALGVGEWIRVGDRYERVLGFYDRDAAVVATFVTLQLGSLSGCDSDISLTLTPRHLVWCAAAGDPSSGVHSAKPVWVTCQAGRVMPGMAVCGADGSPRCVVDVSRTTARGVFSPVTASGSIVVNGIRASVYAKPRALAHFPVSDEALHHVCHAVTWPLRALAALASCLPHGEVAAQVVLQYGVAGVKHSIFVLVLMSAVLTIASMARIAWRV